MSSAISRTALARSRGRRVAVELLELLEDPYVAVSAYLNATYNGADQDTLRLDVVKPHRVQRLIVLEALDRIGADREALTGFAEILSAYLADCGQSDPGHAEGYRAVIATGVEQIT